MMVDVATKPDRVIEVKKDAKPPVGKPYYGRQADNGYREVLIRKERTRKGGEKVYDDQVIWYETVVSNNGDMLPLVCYITSPPPEPNPDVLYPVAIWNISRDRLDEIDYVPFWQIRQLLDKTTAPLYDVDGKPLKVHHYVVVNDRYVPNRTPTGGSDDGNWVPGEPVSGEYLLNKLKAMEVAGGNPMDYLRRRVE